MSSSEWFDGKTAVPPMISLKGRYDGGEPNEIPAQSKPKEAVPSTSLPPTKTQVEAPEPAPAPVPQTVVERGPPPSVKENKQSIETMASKYADKFEDSDDEDDASSFEEVAKPVERPSRIQEPAKPTPAPAPAARSVPVQRQEPTPAPKPASPKESSPPADIAPSSSATARPTSALADGLKTHLSDIKSSQANTLSEMADLKSQVTTLTELVKHLSGRLDSFMGSQSERMRQVELEVEGMRE
jgi:coronin-1B/1C/6